MRAETVYIHPVVVTISFVDGTERSWLGHYETFSGVGGYISVGRDAAGLTISQDGIRTFFPLHTVAKLEQGSIKWGEIRKAKP